MTDEQKVIANTIWFGISLPNYTKEELEPVYDMAYLLAGQLEEADPNFNRAEFIEACGVTE